MTAIDVFISLFLVALLACIAVYALRFLEDTRLLTINKYLAMVASWFFWWSCGAFAALLIIAYSMTAGGVVKITLLNFNWWAFAASTLVYFLTFCYVVPRKKINTPQVRKSK